MRRAAALYLVRHPRPLDVSGLCYGRRDVPVDDESLAHGAASVRAALGAATLAAAQIVSSPSSRCARLARELAAPRQPLLAEELLEMDFGSWEGRRWDDIPRDQLDAWAGDLWCYRPGGAESAASVAERWRRWSANLPGAGGTVIAITHAGVIRVALHCCGALSAAEFATVRVDFGSVHRIEWPA
jgi:alpha-ribazole phosphatase